MHQRSLPGPQGVSPTKQGVSMQRGVSMQQGGSPQRRTPQDGDSSGSPRRRRGSGLCLCPPSGAPFWAWVLLATLLVPGARSYLSEEEEELLVELHNHYRGQVSPSASAMLPLRWDPTLKLLAESYAAKCVWNHNPDLEDTGENLFAGSGPLDLRVALEKWFLERLDYDFQNNSCDEEMMCGHYTQMVWADTHRVGCAFHLCNNMEGLDWERVSFLVCNYFPAGNFEDERPYVEGDSCSRCPDDMQTCENNLCVADKVEEEEDEEEEGTDAPSDPSPPPGEETDAPSDPSPPSPPPGEETDAPSDPSPPPGEETDAPSDPSPPPGEGTDAPSDPSPPPGEGTDAPSDLSPPPQGEGLSTTSDSYNQPSTTSTPSTPSTSSSTRDSEDTPPPGTLAPEVPSGTPEETGEEERKEAAEKTKTEREGDVRQETYQKKKVSISAGGSTASSSSVLSVCLTVILTLRVRGLFGL